MSKSYPTAELIATRMAALAAAHPSSCSISDLGTSVQGRPLKCLRVTRTTHPKAGVILVAGQHADELIGPDALLDFVEKVLVAAETSTDAIYPAVTLTSPSVTVPPWILGNGDARKWLDRLDIRVVALANPDGRAHVQADGVDPWRKNMSTAAPCTAGPPTPSTQSWGSGVNLNRNFDIAWDVHFYDRAWLEPATSISSPRLHISEDGCDSEFHGTAAASEPETRCLQTLVDSVAPRYFFDIHGSDSIEIIYPWGFAPTQTTDPTQSFTRRDLDRVDGDAAHPGRGLAYAEYMLPGTHRHLQSIADTMRSRIIDALGLSASGPLSLPTTTPGGRADDVYSGTAIDYAFSRHFVDGTRPITYALDIECGFDELGGRSPSDENHYAVSSRAIAAAIGGMLDDASNNCVIATAAFGSPLARDVDIMRRLRDEVVRQTRVGRWLLERIEPIYDRRGAPIARYLDGNDRARRVARVALMPLAWLARAAWRLTS